MPLYLDLLLEEAERRWRGVLPLILYSIAFQPLALDIQVLLALTLCVLNMQLLRQVHSRQHSQIHMAARLIISRISSSLQNRRRQTPIFNRLQDLLLLLGMHLP